MHRPTTVKDCGSHKEPAVSWPTSSLDVNAWLKSQPSDKWSEDWDQNGCLVVENLLKKDEVAIYAEIYRKMLVGDIDTGSHRHDLGNHIDQVQKSSENICQIMWPSEYVEDLSKGPLHLRAGAIAKTIMGDDCTFDFDMLISKNAHTNTPTPWHQDESYWLDMPDKRAASFWVAIDEATVDNGCMWFIPGSHKRPLRPHRKAKENCHVNMCDASESEGSPRPLKPGSCTIHHGRMLHYTRGNSSPTQRRAYIVNFRPAEMVKYEREHDYDHGRGKGVNDFIPEKQEK